jgi:cysteinyl-tRNA synthetase
MRFFILQSHYRGTLDFTGEALDAAAKGWEKIMNALRNLTAAVAPHGGSDRSKAGPAADFRKKFLEAMDDDFNTPQAIAVIFDAVREVNTLLAAGGNEVAALRGYAGFFEEAVDCVLGLVPAQGQGAEGSSIEPQLLDFIVELRADVRKEKLWSLSDKIRDALQKLGVTLEDKKEGTTWKRS